jgi:hypothetical protein
VATDVVADSCSYLQFCRRAASFIRLLEWRLGDKFRKLESTVKADDDEVEVNNFLYKMPGSGGKTREIYHCQ